MFPHYFPFFVYIFSKTDLRQGIGNTGKTAARIVVHNTLREYDVSVRKLSEMSFTVVYQRRSANEKVNALKFNHAFKKYETTMKPLC